MIVRTSGMGAKVNGSSLKAGIMLLHIPREINVALLTAVSLGSVPREMERSILVCLCDVVVVSLMVVSCSRRAEAVMSICGHMIALEERL